MSEAMVGSKSPSGTSLREQYYAIKQSNPKMRARDAARSLNVSEAEWVACRVGDGVVRLKTDWVELIKALPSLRRVMVLTRNEHCVHEKYGEFDNISIGPGHGLVLNRDIDLRLFLNHWHFGFAVSEELTSGLRHSLQFFDLDGCAVHKIYTTADTDMEAYDSLVERFRAADELPDITVLPHPAPRPERPDSEIDIANFHKHWRALQDTHDFFGMLQEFGLRRQQAMRLAEREFAYPVANQSLEQVLNLASEKGLPIMCFVGNPGCIQIHTGPIHTLKRMGSWFNILDPGFNLHLREDAISESWVVRKPTRDGIVTSLELFDRAGSCFVQFFGERKPGNEERSDWRATIESLPHLSGAQPIPA